MKEEDIDKRIERVVESVGSKKAAMRRWESDRVASEAQRKVAIKRWRTYGISAAASVVVIFAVGIGVYMQRIDDQNLGGSAPSTVYRGGAADIDEIAAMIDSAKYQEAIQAIEASMADTVIDSTYPPERQEYLRSVNKNQEYELTWLKIQVLVKLDKKQDARALLESYIRTDGSHQIEAKGLLEKMKE